MTNPSQNDDLRGLLLRRLSDERMEALEQRLIVEDGLVDALRHEEYELIDAYARGELTADDRRAVENHLLRTPADRQRMRIARALQGMAAQRSSPPVATVQTRRPFPRKWLPFATIALAAAILVTITVIAVNPFGRNSHQESKQIAASSAKPQAAASPAISDTLTLLASVARGADVQDLQLSNRPGDIRLQAEIDQPGGAGPYTLIVSDAAAVPLLTQKNLPLRSAGQHVFIETIVPKSVLAGGIRRITVQRDGQAADSFPFSWTVRISFAG